MFSNTNSAQLVIQGVAIGLLPNIFTFLFVAMLTERPKYKRIGHLLNEVSLRNFLLRLLGMFTLNTLASVAFIFAVSVDNPYRIAFCVTIVIMTLAIEWAYVRRWAGLPILPRRRP